MLSNYWHNLSTREQRLLQLVAALVVVWGLVSLVRPGWQHWQQQSADQARQQQQLALLREHLPHISPQAAPDFLRGATTLQLQLQRTLSRSGLPTSALRRHGELWQVQLNNIREAQLWQWFDLLVYCQGQLVGFDLRQRSPGILSLSLQMAERQTPALAIPARQAAAQQGGG
ncbi:MAG: type II secretion system protein GspM [Marinobacterium sp.]|nr:type II secretion system protein GspM [Marinobacterium sp.]